MKRSVQNQTSLKTLSNNKRLDVIHQPNNPVNLKHLNLILAAYKVHHRKLKLTPLSSTWMVKCSPNKTLTNSSNHG